MAKLLANQVALVTGGSRGIGRAICKALDAEGAQVVVHYHRNRVAAEEVCASLQSQATMVQADLGSAASLDQMVKSLGEVKLDILVNNAGVWKSTPLGSTSEEALDEVIDTNFKGIFWLTQAVLPKVRNGGRIVNISSTAAQAAVPGRSVYGATKAAVEAFTKNWALELAPRRIRVNAVAPGYIETDMTAAHLGDPETRKNVLQRHPFGRLGAPEDVAKVVLFLCTQASAFMTGQTLNVSGGFAL